MDLYVYGHTIIQALATGARQAQSPHGRGLSGQRS